jgi:outer membrane protein OmpA-like peptidoglycan-associated protein
MAVYDLQRRPAVAGAPKKAEEVVVNSAGNAAMTRLLVQREPGLTQETPATTDSVCVWFAQNSARVGRDSGRLIAVAAASVRAHLARNKSAKIIIAGYASEEGTTEYNLSLSAKRAAAIKAELVRAGIAEDRLVDVGRGESRSWPVLALNRRVDVEVPYDSSLDEQEAPAPAQAGHKMSEAEEDSVNRLQRLHDYAMREGGDGAQFATMVLAFRTTLQHRINAVQPGDPLPPDVQIVMRALILWMRDDGRTWGEGNDESSNVILSFAGYATVPASQNKCNTYVAEVLYKAVGTVHKVHESDRQEGRYFPYRAREWGNQGQTIEHYPVVTSNPQMGDVWSNGSHVGIFLGEYNGKLLYISARDDGDGVFALRNTQHAHGVQIKLLPTGGVYRRFDP